jgi:hypothetical protein
LGPRDFKTLARNAKTSLESDDFDVSGSNSLGRYRVSSNIVTTHRSIPQTRLVRNRRRCCKRDSLPDESSDLSLVKSVKGHCPLSATLSDCMSMAVPAINEIVAIPLLISAAM